MTLEFTKFRDIEDTILRKLKFGKTHCIESLTFCRNASNGPFNDEEIEIIKKTDPSIFPVSVTFKKGSEILIQHMPRKIRIMDIHCCDLNSIIFPELDDGCHITIIFDVEQIDSNIFDRLPVNIEKLRLELIMPPTDIFFDRTMKKKFMNLPPMIKEIEYDIHLSSMSHMRRDADEYITKITDVIEKNITEYFPISDSLETISLNKKVVYART